MFPSCSLSNLLIVKHCLSLLSSSLPFQIYLSLSCRLVFVIFTVYSSYCLRLLVITWFFSLTSVAGKILTIKRLISSKCFLASFLCFSIKLSLSSWFHQQVILFCLVGFTCIHFTQLRIFQCTLVKDLFFLIVMLCYHLSFENFLFVTTLGFLLPQSTLPFFFHSCFRYCPAWLR